MALFCGASGVVVMAFFCRVLAENFERDVELVIEYSCGETRANRRKLTRQQNRIVKSGAARREVLTVRPPVRACVAGACRPVIDKSGRLPADESDLANRCLAGGG
eukprot:15470294-Alexandrium_andersonii.AAC.1